MHRIPACFILAALALGVAADAAHGGALVAHWALDETSGSVATDSSGNNHNGTVGGTATWIAGRVGGALDFDGSSTYIDVDGQLVKGTCSVALWLKARNLPYTGDFRAICHNDAWDTGSLHGHLRADTSLFNFDINGGGAVTSTTVAQSNEWYHVAGTFNVAAGQSKLYVNGVLEATATGLTPSVYMGPLNWGAWTNNQRYFNGPMDDIRIYNRVLSAENVQGLANGVAPDFRKAVDPIPANGAADVSKFTLTWTAGELAVSHKVYFGESFDAVNDGTVEPVSTTSASFNTKSLPAYAAGLVSGTTYYWRVDEINPSNPASPWRGDVWSFTVPPKTAWDPAPADGAQYVPVNQTLTWKPGLNALLHYVNTGEDLDTVKNAPLGTGMPSANPAFTPDASKPGTTYYWRVDEFRPPATFVQGAVWSFRTIPDIPVADPTLSGHWKLDEGEGITAVDWSGHGGHGTLVNGPQWADGFYGGALSFTTGGQYVNCGTAAAEDVIGDFTLAAWIKMAPANSGRYMGIAGKLNTTYQGFGIVRHSSDVLRMWVGDGSTDLAKSAVSSDVTYTDSDWHHVAAVHEGTANWLFVDGRKQGGTTNVTLAPSADFFHIGRQYSNSDDRYFSGLIDDVRVYSKAMAEAEIGQVLAGDPLVASGATPGVGAVTDIRDAGSLSWSAGTGAASHDVYFGTDRKAVAAAGKTSPEFKGNQSGTSFSLAGLVAFGGGDYFWRIDEVEAGGQVHTGYTWKFTVPAFLIVDAIEGYTNNSPTRIFQTWIDGFGFSADEFFPKDNPGNGTSASVGHDIWTETSPWYQKSIAELGIIHPGGSTQSMPFDYNNIRTPNYSETSRTWSTAQNWTTEGATTLVLYVRGVQGNDATQPMYVALENQGKPPVVVNLDASVLTSESWTEVKIPLSQFTGVNPAAVKTMYIGVGNRAAPKPGGHGLLYIDDIRVIKPAP